ncbi:MAG: hypothetical protein JW729_10380 [Bacteroidales bacterium]|nr:hypothetical protein [Bacteroidales bacterium]
MNSISKIKKSATAIIILLIIAFISCKTATNNNKTLLSVDENGVLRWENKEEVHGFGVNYTVPFAHAFRSAKKLGIDPKAAIKNDVYHFSRLGFDLFRVHVWDTEISDTLGNLLDNEHLNTFDFLLYELKNKGIHVVMTPIAFWGNGWPDRDEDTPGFSHKYGHADCLTNPDAIKAQQNYLQQILNHVNPYTGIAYKDEPTILAFEISNEPHHSGEASLVTEFVKGMVQAMKDTGLEKPIFYNISHGVHFINDYFAAGIDGGTFQWYPTGLGYQHELSGNLLPNVNDYTIPFEQEIKKDHGAKIVYEFDAADVGKSYIYPAIARSFRKAGIQLATHFAYDPTFLAYANTEYNTHYMNLVYAPQKALSLMISAEVFHQIPIYQDFGLYPKNLAFDNFKIDYENDLAEYNATEKFIYTNTTNSIPKDEAKLNLIAGFGNSKLVRYDGVGAYFLDKIKDGTWRLEVLPDAIWVDNLFGRNSLGKTVAVIKWETHSMIVQIENLGKEFELIPINSGNDFKSKVKDGQFDIRPGTYILSRSDSMKDWLPSDAWKYGKLNDFYAPETTVNKAWMQHFPLDEVSANRDLKLIVQYVAPIQPKEIQLEISNGSASKTLVMEQTNPYQYSASISADFLIPGTLEYHFLVEQENNYKLSVKKSTDRIVLFSAEKDGDLLVKPWQKGVKFGKIENVNPVEYQINVENLFVKDNENLNATPIYDYSFKHFVLKQIEGRKKDLLLKKQLVVQGYALNQKANKMQVAFVLKDGNAFGSLLTIEPKSGEYSIDLNNLKPVKTVTLPRPYPSFLPFYFEHNLTSQFDIQNIESIQFSFGSGLTSEEIMEPQGIALQSIYLK